MLQLLGNRRRTANITCFVQTRPSSSHMSFSNISLGMLIMNASNIWALVQPCVACLLGASRKAGASVWASHIPCLKSLKQTVGLASTSAVPAIIRNVTAQHSFASVSAKPSREKKDRHGADNKEDDSRLVSVVLRKASDSRRLVPVSQQPLVIHFPSTQTSSAPRSNK